MDAAKTGALIAQERKKRGLTQRELAERLHVSAAAVSKWERELSLPDIALLEPLGDVLGLTAAELLAGTRYAPAAEESLRELLRLAAGQMKNHARRQRRRMAAALAVLLLISGAIFCWQTGRFPRRETTLTPRAIPEESLWWAGDLVDGSALLFDLSPADDFQDLSLRLEYWTAQGMEQSWELYATHTAGHGWTQEEKLGVALDPLRDESGTLRYQVLLSHSAFSGSVEGLPGLTAGQGYEAVALSERLRIDREQGALLYCYVLDPSSPQRPDKTAWFDAQQMPQPQDGEAFLVLRLLCEYGT